jgi:hypothetical protein
LIKLTHKYELFLEDSVISHTLLHSFLFILSRGTDMTHWILKLRTSMAEPLKQRKNWLGEAHPDCNELNVPPNSYVDILALRVTVRRQGTCEVIRS